MKAFLIQYLALVFVLSSWGARTENDVVADVVIWDATPAGIAAAVAATRAGHSACIVTEYEHIGGLQTSGLGNTNAGQRDTVGGLAREFHNRVHSYYRDRYGEDSEQVQACQTGFRFEPHVAEAVYEAWLKEAGVTVLREKELKGVHKQGARLRGLVTENGVLIAGRVFVDASYEGDLLALAGCQFHLGRESSDQYGESLAGVRHPPEEMGKADAKLQGYDYRLCLTDDPDNRIPFVKPANYDPTLYAHLAARFRAKPPERLHRLVPLNKMPNRKTDSRTGEWTGESWDYPKSSLAQRREIERAHRAYAEGYLWFVLTDLSVPEPIRDELGRWGYAKDEFRDNSNWPYRIYVREARRLVGDFVMTQADVTEQRVKPDGVALGSFYLDVHPVQLVPDSSESGGVFPEGGLGRQRVRPYEIPYRALVPRRSEAENLLVPVCVSASHVAYSTIRMEPVYMMLGHVAGEAAALAIDLESPVGGVSVDELRKRLSGAGQLLDSNRFTKLWP